MRAAGGRIPELKRVIVAHQNQIVMEETLEAADVALADLALRAHEHYVRAMKAQRDGDWALYGEEIKKLGEVLELMRKQRRTHLIEYPKSASPAVGEDNPTVAE